MFFSKFASFLKRRNEPSGLSRAAWVERRGATPGANALLEKEPKGERASGGGAPVRSQVPSRDESSFRKRSKKEHVEIDGSLGEGGGQVLRTALSLSIATGKALRIFNIRAGRAKPGLAHQHLTCIKAAKQISSATVGGATLGSQSLEFEPGRICPGDYSFDVTTAGSVSLVFQTLFLPLSLTKKESCVTIRGGTHVKWSPSYEFLRDQWSFYLQKMGFAISIRLEKAGYYPKGGGILKARVQPAEKPRPLMLSDRGELQKVTGRVFFSNLKRSIADRQLAKTTQMLLSRGLSPQIEIREYPSPGVGTGTHLRAAFENGSGSFTSLGERGVPAERVASVASERLCDYMDSGAAVDRFIADQLVLPLSFARGESFFTCERITQHLLTNSRVVEMFVPVRVEVDGEVGCPGQVRIIPQASIADCDFFDRITGWTGFGESGLKHLCISCYPVKIPNSQIGNRKRYS